MLWSYKSCDTQIGPPKEENAMSSLELSIYYPVVGSSLGICFEVSMICLYGAKTGNHRSVLLSFLALGSSSFMIYPREKGLFQCIFLVTIPKDFDSVYLWWDIKMYIFNELFL